MIKGRGALRPNLWKISRSHLNKSENFTICLSKLDQTKIKRSVKTANLSNWIFFSFWKTRKLKSCKQKKKRKEKKEKTWDTIKESISKTKSNKNGIWKRMIIDGIETFDQIKFESTNVLLKLGLNLRLHFPSRHTTSFQRL